VRTPRSAGPSTPASGQLLQQLLSIDLATPHRSHTAAHRRISRTRGPAEDVAVLCSQRPIIVKGRLCITQITKSDVQCVLAMQKPDATDMFITKCQRMSCDTSQLC
jgi:hypothetical protein